MASNSSHTRPRFSTLASSKGSLRHCARTVLVASSLRRRTLRWLAFQQVYPLSGIVSGKATETIDPTKVDKQSRSAGHAKAFQDSQLIEEIIGPVNPELLTRPSNML
jgi:hypothetical protein